MGSGDFLASAMLAGGMWPLEIAFPSSSSLHSTPSDPTVLLGDHNTILDYALLNHCESPALIDVIDSITLAIEKNSSISGIHYLEHKGYIKMMWKSDKEVGLSEKKRCQGEEQTSDEKRRGRKREK